MDRLEFSECSGANQVSVLLAHTARVEDLAKGERLVWAREEGRVGVEGGRIF